MKIKFKIAHPSGIPAGTVREVGDKFGARMIEKKFAEATDEDVTPAPKKEFPKPDPGKNRNSAANEDAPELTKAQKGQLTKLKKRADALDITMTGKETIPQLEELIKIKELKDECEDLKIELTGDETIEQLEELIKIKELKDECEDLKIELTGDETIEQLEELIAAEK